MNLWSEVYWFIEICQIKMNEYTNYLLEGHPTVVEEISLMIM